MDSICHQGVFNVTNAFANTLWLVDRFGVMANRGTPLMARQSLIGFNYSLLGNFPARKREAKKKQIPKKKKEKTGRHHTGLL